MFTRLVIPANATEMKNRIENSCPMGIWRKMFGSVINIKGGPALGWIPKANTAGMIASAASMAARVSNTAVWMEERGMSSSFFR